ncbi:MAG: response regulator, partial [Elusimicrobia bacterium]|nr:response regulator [Elusimicrobiota bacterium]
MAKILIIDDDGIVRDAVKSFLSRNGHEVFCAADGLNGITLYKNIRPDAVILDREMPNLTGSQVLEKIREFSKTVPVIILTGYDSPEDAAQYIKEGATSFLSKAGGLVPLLDEIEKICPSNSNTKRENIHMTTAKKEKTEKILIADDEEPVRNMLSRFVASLGFKAIIAENGTQAVELFKKEKPEIILLDIYMPQKNGIEALEEIISQDPSSAVMMITGNDEEDLARLCLKKGAFDYISKP